MYGAHLIPEIQVPNQTVELGSFDPEQFGRLGDIAARLIERVLNLLALGFADALVKASGRSRRWWTGVEDALGKVFGTIRSESPRTTAAQSRSEIPAHCLASRIATRQVSASREIPRMRLVDRFFICVRVS